MLLTAKTVTAMFAVCARTALIGSVVLQVPLDQLLGGPLRRFGEVELDTIDSTREPKGESVAVAGVHRRHGVLPDVQALESEPSRDLFLDSALTDQVLAVEQAYDGRSAPRLGRSARERRVGDDVEALEREPVVVVAQPVALDEEAPTGAVSPEADEDPFGAGV